MLAVLLRQRGRLLWNRVTRGQRRGRRILGTTVAAVFTFGFVAFAGLNAGVLVDRVARVDPVAAVDALPVMLASVAVLTLITSLSSAFHHLFMASDLELLLAAPVPPRSLFGLKIFEIWRDSLHIILFQGAALYGFGQSLHLPASYYVAALAIGLLLTLSASAVGATVTLALARVRFGESILGVSRLLALLLFLPVGVLGMPTLGLRRGGGALLLGQGSVESAVGALRTVGDPPAWAPTTWAAHVLLGDNVALLSALLLVSTAIVVFSTLNLVYARLFQGGWERVRFSPAAPRSNRRRRLVRLPEVALPTGALAGVLLKDWRTIVRDPRWRTGTLFTLVALGLPATILFAGDPFARSDHLVRFWVSMLPVPYLAYLFGNQQGASTLIYEGRNLALLRAAPVSMTRILGAKVLGGLALVLLVTWVTTLAVGLVRAGQPLEMVAAIAAASWLAVGASVCAVTGAALTADFESDNPQRRVGCLGTLVTSALSIFFFVTNLALLAWWIGRGVLNLPRFLLGVLPFLDWGLPVLAVVSVGAIIFASRAAVARLATWEQS